MFGPHSTTLAVGSLRAPRRFRRGAAMSSGKDAPKSAHITWSHSAVSREQRRKLTGHGAATLWFTGLSGSGKSTLAVALEQRLVERRVHAYVLDGDNIRHGLNKNLGFSPADRSENIRRIGEVAKLFNDAGVIVLTAFISPYGADRDAVRALLPPGEFIEVLVQCPIEECERRDAKGLYKKARAGQIPEFTGISAPYEAPERPELVLDTAADDVETCVARLLEELERRGILA
jgi:adenylylsulfate kinase